MSLPRYPEYKDSGVEWLGEVPRHWQIQPLYGCVIERSESNKGMAEDNLLSLSYGRIVPKDIASNDGLLPESFETYQIVRPGDIVFRLTDLQNDKRSLRSAISQHTGIITSAYLVVSPIGPDARFMYYLFRAYDATKVFYSMGGGLRQSMKFSDLKRLPTLLPPLAEQAHITEFLDRETAKIDALVAEQQRLIELLKEKRQAVISHAVTKGLNPNAPMKDSSIEWLGEVPAHWEVKRLRNVSPRLAGRLIVQPHLYFEDDGVPIVFGNNIQRGRVCLDDIKRISFEADERFAGSRVSAGDLLTVRVGDPGATAVVPETLNGCHFASTMLIRKSSTFDSQWLCHVMNSHIVGLQIDRVCYGAAQEQFNIRDAADFLIPFPPRSEQSRLAAYLDRATTAHDELSDEASHAIDLLIERRTALISAAVTGQIDVRPRTKKR